MVTWSRQDLENWADAILQDALKEKYESFAPIDLMKLAAEYLGITIRYEVLSDNLDVYGISVFQRTTLSLQRNGTTEYIEVDADTILLEQALQQKHLFGVRRFTKAHEIAHQILMRWEQRALVTGTPEVAYLHRARGEHDWREWQADTLGSCLLMPRRLIDECLFRFGVTGKISVYERHYLAPKDRMMVSNIAEFLGVSKAALLNRLVALGHAERKTASEWFERMWF